MAAGDGANLAGYAYAFPDNDAQKMQMVNYLHQSSLQEQQRKEQQAKDEQAHKFALQKYYGSQFDPSKFDTKTALNNSINDLALKGRQTVSDAIKNGESDEDIDQLVQQQLAPIYDLYTKGTQIKSSIDNTTGALKDENGIDTQALQKAAMLKALFNVDPNGNVKIKNQQELDQADPSTDYVHQLLQSNPDAFTKGSYDIYNVLNKDKPFKNEGSGAYYSSPGVKRKGSFAATWYPGQKLSKDANGVQSVVAENDPYVDQKTGTTINRVPKEVFDHYTPTLSDKLQFAKYAADEANKMGVNVTPGTPQFDNFQRNLLYNQLNQMGGHLISQKNDVQMAAPVIKMQLGIPQGGQGGSEGQKEVDVKAAFDSLNDAPVRTDAGIPGKIQEGKFVPVGGKFPVNAGTPKFGTIDIENLPDAIRNAVANYSKGNNATGKVYDKTLDKYVPSGKVKVKFDNSGNVVGVLTDDGTWFNNIDLTNSAIKQQNSTTSMKNKQPYVQPKALTGKVDPKQLRTGQLYSVNGKNYVWDGSNLKAQ